MRAVILLAILAGVVFRFTGIDNKVFWYDEAYTAMPVAGFTRNDVQDALVARSKAGEELHFKSLAPYQSPNPHRTLVDTVVAVGDEEPQNAPLFFIAARGWEQLFGGSLHAMRLLPVLFGLLAIPAFYWLLREMRFSRLAGGVGAALIAVSPLHVLYSQEYRQYSLLTLATLLASALALRAMRTNRTVDWGAFCLVTIAGLYSHFFYLFVLAAHVAYIAVLERFRVTARAVRGAIATVVAVVVYSPWIVLVLTSLDDISGWRGEDIPVVRLVGRWLLAVGFLFFDRPGGENPFDLFFDGMDPMLWASLAAVALSVGAFYTFTRHARAAALFCGLLAAATLLPLLLPDIIEGGIRSTIPRYLEPVYIALLAAVAFALARWATAGSAWLRISAQTGLAVLAVAGIWSNVEIARADTWWIKYTGYRTPDFANAINAYPNARVASNNPARLIALGYLLDPDIALFFGDGDENEPVVRRPGEKDFFIFGNNATKLTNLEEMGCSFDLVLEFPVHFIDRAVRLRKLRGDPATAPCFADAPTVPAATPAN